MAGSPGVIPKAALTASRVIYKPFTIPKKLDESATLVGAISHNIIGKTNAAVAESYAALQPKGPAKWLLPVFAKVDGSVQKSAGMADRAHKVFWGPLGDGVEGVGRAIAGPGASYYANRAGFDGSNPDVIKGLLNLKLFQYPVNSGPPAGAEQQQAPPAAEQQAAPAQ